MLLLLILLFYQLSHFATLRFAKSRFARFATLTLSMDIPRYGKYQMVIIGCF
jgi:hypothetical protein